MKMKLAEVFKSVVKQADSNRLVIGDAFFVANGRKLMFFSGEQMGRTLSPEDVVLLLNWIINHTQIQPSTATFQKQLSAPST